VMPDVYQEGHGMGAGHGWKGPAVHALQLNNQPRIRQWVSGLWLQLSKPIHRLITCAFSQHVKRLLLVTESRLLGSHLLDDLLASHHHLGLHAVNDGCQPSLRQSRKQHVVLDGDVCMKQQQE